MSVAVALGKDDGITLTRAEYLGPLENRRVVMEYDATRAALSETPWWIRPYIRRPHATTPRGEAWKLARRGYHRRSVAAALSELRPWLTGEVDTPTRARRAVVVP